MFGLRWRVHYRNLSYENIQQDLHGILSDEAALAQLYYLLFLLILSSTLDNDCFPAKNSQLDQVF